MDESGQNAAAMAKWDADLTKIHSDWCQTKSADSWKKYVISCVAYFCSDIFVSSKKHWFCADEETRKRAVSSLTILSFEESSATRHYQESYKEKLTGMLSNCYKCAIKYQISSPESMESLVENSKVPCEIVEAFYKNMERSDKARLSQALDEDEYSFTALSEALWSSSCSASSKFINERFSEAGPLKSGDPQEAAKFDANPGFSVFKFVALHNLRKVTLRTIIGTDAKDYIEAWKSAPRLFKNALVKGIRRNSHATESADPAWFTVASIFRALSSEPAIGTSIADICYEEMTSAGGIPKFGANYLVYLLFKAKISSQSCVTLSSEHLETVLDYVTKKTTELQYHAPLPKQSNEETTSATYRDLDAQVVVEWFKLYLTLKPAPERVKEHTSFLLNLQTSAFKTTTNYQNAALASFKAVSICPGGLFSLVLMDNVNRMFEVYDRFPSEPVYHLWKFQQEYEEMWSPLWLKIVRDPLFGTRILAQKHMPGIVRGLLEGSRKIGLKWQVPTKLVAARDLQASAHSGEPNKDVTKSSTSEEVLGLLLEQICDVGEPENLTPVILDKRILRNTLILSISGNRKLSLAAHEFVRLASGEDSFESAINKLVKEESELLLGALNSILESSAGANATWLAAMPGLIRSSLRVLDAVYDVNDGIDTIANQNITLMLHIFWTRSWEMITNVIRQIKDWAGRYNSNYSKPILINISEFSKGLSTKFRLIEADSTESKLPKQNWGSSLAAPVISSVTNMSALLQSAIPDSSAMAFDIIIDILDSMSSFEVPAPDSLLSLLERSATRRTRSKLTKEQLKVLLVKVGSTDDEASQVVEQQITGIVLKNNELEVTAKQTERASSVGSAEERSFTTRPLSSHSQSQQKSIGDFFKTSTGSKLVIPPRKIVNNQVIPNAAPHASALSQIRAQLHETSSTAIKRPLTRGTIGTIHPERPPGFNNPKAVNQANESDEDEEEEEEEEEGALGALGADKKREEAHLKSKQAYAASLGNKPSGPTILPTLGKIGQSKQLQEEQKVREARAMKARLNAQPTESHRILLSWDYFSASAPVTAKGSIPDKFDTVEQYQEVMSPLLYLEAWEGIQKSKEEAEKYTPSLFQLIFGKRVKVDGFTDVYVSATKASFANSGISEGAFLLLGYDEATANEVVRPSQNIPHFLARVKEGTIKSSRNPKKQHVDFQIRLNVELGVLNKLYNGSTVNGVSIGVFTTVEREFTALTALSHYSLLKHILQATPTIGNDSSERISRMQMNLGLNKSQATAVSRAVVNQGFSLIQGPPGTGKTKTILGIIGALFTNSAMNVHATGDKLDTDKKILICAPSNAAVDEIVLRLKGGVIDSYGARHKLNISRMGRREVVNEQVRDVTLEEIIGKDLDNNAEISDSQLRREHTALTMERNEVREKLKDITGSERLSEQDVKILSDKSRSSNTQSRDKSYALDAQRESLEKARKQRDANYKQQQNDIVSKAQVICSTLSGSAQPLLTSLGITFETVIIDEAAQSIELSALIPLKYGAKKCILVGDPNQLPPTVLSKEASILRYEQSLFVRMYNQYKDVPGAVSMSDTQFRMHPEISQFPSAEFYSRKLLDGPGLSSQSDRPWHHEFRASGPYTFFNVKGTHERYNGHSLRNQAEASAALGLVKHIHRKYPDVTSIGVISPYKEQVRLMEHIFVQSLGADVTSFVDFNSIDGFQGQEKDIIIMSCVRAADARVNHVGFLGDVRRMNVALTRAKASLWVLGHVDSLIVNPVWERLIADASSRGHLVEAHTSNIMTAVQQFDKVATPAGKRQRTSKHSSPSTLDDKDDEVSATESPPKKQVCSTEPTEIMEEAALDAAKDVIERDDYNENTSVEDITVEAVCKHVPPKRPPPRKFNKGQPSIFIQSNRGRKRM